MPRRPWPEDGAEGLDFSATEAVALPRLTDTVAARIRAFIVARELTPGTRLPSERALAQALGTSRPTVSQALRTLALMGIIESRRGSGAYVLRRPDDAPATQLWRASAANLDELLQLRLWLESLATREAVKRADAAQITAVRDALERLTRSSGEPAAWIAADTVFHATVVSLAGNQPLTAIYEQVHTALLEYEYRLWVQGTQAPDWLSPTAADEMLQLHAPIVEALAARDMQASLRAVRAHSDAMGHHLRARDSATPAGARA